MEITDEPYEIVARPGSGDPFLAMRREMENVFRAFDQKPSSTGIGAGAPAISVAETNDSFEVTAELPGVDEKDINVSLDDNQLVVSGEEKGGRARKKKRTGTSRSGATAHSIDRCFYLLSRKREPLKLISTKVCCISRSRSPRRSLKLPRQLVSRRAPHRARALYRTRPHRARPLSPERSSQGPGDANQISFRLREWVDDEV